MSKVSTRPARRQAAAARRRGPSTARNAAIVGAAIGLIGVVAVVAVLVSRLGSSSGAASAPPAETAAVSLTGAALPLLPAAGPDPAVGRMAPLFSGTGFGGGAITVSADGHPHVVVVVAHWCPHCQREVPVLTSWLRGHSLPNGVEVYAVSTAATSDRENYPPSAWLQREGWPVPTVRDDDAQTITHALGMTGYPFMVFVDSQGRVAGRHAGEITAVDFASVVASLH